MILIFPTFYLSLLPFSAGIKKAENLPSLIIPVRAHHWVQHMRYDQDRFESLFIIISFPALFDQAPKGDVPLSDL